ncbi:MAG TPA: leucyl aminopeptidase family protein [Opitutales bacterium]|nr:leucyl aminopeptidase family protein [Opitutales bacterium]
MTELLFDGDASGLGVIRFATVETAAAQSGLTAAEFSGETGSTALSGLPAAQTLWTGIGAGTSIGPNSLRLASAYAGRRLAEAGKRVVAIDCGPWSDFAGEIVEGAILGAYHFNRFKTKDRPETGLKALCLNGLDDVMKARARDGAKIANAVNRARDLGNMPPNLFKPEDVAEAAETYVRLTGASLTILNEFELAEQGFGGIVAVGSGSANLPRLIILKRMVDPAWPTVALAGKTVTFDSGGLSIKSAKDLYEEKWDKCGGMAVFGILECVTALGIPVNVVAALPAVENLPGPAAMRPGDVITMKGGKTVEITDTDAEGRIILADTLAWLAETFSPDLTIDIATLTGACVVALGQETSGLFTDDDELAAVFTEAGAASGDACWRLPLGPEYARDLKSGIADIRNAGSSRWGGAGKAAEFLKAFKGDGRWVHLDIAGTGMPDEDLGHMERGATGAGIRLTAEALKRLFPTGAAR